MERGGDQVREERTAGQRVAPRGGQVLERAVRAQQVFEWVDPEQRPEQARDRRQSGELVGDRDWDARVDQAA